MLEELRNNLLFLLGVVIVANACTGRISGEKLFVDPSLDSCLVQFMNFTSEYSDTLFYSVGIGRRKSGDYIVNFDVLSADIPNVDEFYDSNIHSECIGYALFNGHCIQVKRYNSCDVGSVIQPSCLRKISVNTEGGNDVCKSFSRHKSYTIDGGGVIKELPIPEPNDYTILEQSLYSDLYVIYDKRFDSYMFGHWQQDGDSLFLTPTIYYYKSALLKEHYAVSPESYPQIYMLLQSRLAIRDSCLVFSEGEYYRMYWRQIGSTSISKEYMYVEEELL